MITPKINLQPMKGDEQGDGKESGRTEETQVRWSRKKRWIESEEI